MTSATASKVVDPVCGMTIDPATAAGTSVHDGVTYFFCSKSCKTKFDAAPEKYGARNVVATSGCHTDGVGKSCCE